MHRLRWIKQLGAIYLIVPEAGHTRFEHSEGVAHMTDLWIMEILAKQPELRKHCPPRTRRLIKMAAMLHDTGHGPASHTFENDVYPVLIQRQSNGPGYYELYGARMWMGVREAGNGVVYGVRRKNPNYDHERISAVLFNTSISEVGPGLDEWVGGEIGPEDLTFMHNVILGRAPEGTEPEKRWMYEIIENRKTQVSPNVMDYLIRDSYFLGEELPFDWLKIVHSIRVIDGSIAFEEGVREDIQAFHDHFYKMFRDYYFDGRVAVIEHMFADAMILAGEELGLADAVRNIDEDPSAYLRMTDNILETIRLSESDSEDMTKARAIMERARKGDYYVTLLEAHLVLPIHFKHMCKVSVIDYFITRPMEPPLSDCLIVQYIKIDSGTGGKEPMGEHTFYRDGCLDHEFCIEDILADIGNGVPCSAWNMEIPTLSREMKYQKRILRFVLRDQTCRDDAMSVILEWKSIYDRCIGFLTRENPG